MVDDAVIERIVVELAALRDRVARIDAAEVVPSSLRAPDGDPDPALEVAGDGAVSVAVSLELASGAAVTEFSTDGDLVGNSDAAVPTEKAVATAISGAWKLISKTTLGSDTASVSFSSIAGTYEALMILVEARTARAAASDVLAIQFNSDTGANYDYMRLAARGNGTLAYDAAAAQSSGRVLNTEGANSRASFFAAGMIYIGGYATSGHERSYIGLPSMVLADRTTTDMYVSMAVGAWRSTAAITAVTLLSGTGSNLKSGSSFALYGIRK